MFEDMPLQVKWVSPDGIQGLYHLMTSDSPAIVALRQNGDFQSVSIFLGTEYTAYTAGSTSLHVRLPWERWES